MPIEKMMLRKPDQGFTTIPNKAINAMSTAESLAILVYLASKPQSWVVRKKDIMNSLDLGETRYKKGVDELKSLNLWQTADIRDDKGLLQGKVIWIFTEVPENRTSEKPDLRENSTLINKGLTKKRNNNICREVLQYLNDRTGHAYRPVESNTKLISARLEEGYTKDDLKTVINKKVSEWAGTKQAQYLRPATLFNAEKFNNYVGQVTKTIDQFADCL